MLAAAQAEAEQKPVAELEAQKVEARKADDEIDPDEASTRMLIDEQLRQAGWECDSDKPASQVPQHRQLRVADRE